MNRVFIDGQKKIDTAEFVRDFSYFMNCEVVNEEPSKCNRFFRVKKISSGWKVDGKVMTDGDVKSFLVKEGLA